MKFGEKRRAKKEEARRQKETQQKKTLKILIPIIAVLAVIIGIGTLTEKKETPTIDTPGISDTVLSTPSADVSEDEPLNDVSQPDSTAPTNDTTQGENTSQPTTTPAPETQNPIGTTQTPVTVTISFSDIPAYSGSPYVAINGNEPSFAKSDFTTTSSESYSSLDSLGRCGVAFANIGKDIMPTEERGSIGQVKPTGWHTVKYDIVDGKYLYNRCHLIGYQLTAENANTKNLITGTRYLNVDGMLPFENMVADYIKETNNHVLYRVTPIFDGDNLVATGVQMEAMSVEDEGDGICFNVFCYNVQPGVSIDYATGDSELTNGGAAETTPPATTAPSQTTQSPATTTPSTTPAEQTEQTYILNTNTYKFHYPSCSSVGQMNESNKQEYTGNRDDLIAQGYAPCGRCHP